MAKTELMVIPQTVREALATRSMTEAQWNTLTNVLYPGASPATALLVWDYCAARKLDPFKKPVHVVPMTTREEDADGNVKWIKRETVLPGIYEYRITAARTGEYLGHDEPEFGAEKEMFGVVAPEWCKFVVYRWNEKAKMKVAYPVKVMFAEACGTKKKSKTDTTLVANGRWERAPKQMLVKCFDTETEVLTEHGFKLFKDVRENNSRILQVGLTGMTPCEATPFVQNYSGPMVTLDSDDLNFSVTPNHDMVTTHGKMEAHAMWETARARATHWIPRRVPPSQYDAVGFSDEALTLAGAFIADGTHRLDSNTFDISVSRPRKVERLTALGLHSSTRTRQAAGDEALGRSGRVIVTRKDKVIFRYSTTSIPPVVDFSRRDKHILVDAILALSSRQARILVDAWVEFDGYVDNVSGTRRVFMSRVQHAEAFEVAAVHAGYAVSPRRARFSDIGSKCSYVFTISDRDECPVVRWGRGDDLRSKKNVAKRTSLELVANESGLVWCVTVETGVIVVRRNGFSMLCGNCTEAAALREAFPEEIGGVPTMEEIDDHMPEVIDATSPRVEDPPVMEMLTDEQRETLDKAFGALKMSKAQSLVKVNEFVKADAVQDGFERLIEWCRDEYAAKSGKPRAKKETDNSKAAEAKLDPKDIVEATVVAAATCAEMVDEVQAATTPQAKPKAEEKPKATPKTEGKKGEWF